MSVACTIKLLLTEYLTILAKANLALARIVNYDHKVKHKLNHTFMIINYDRQIFLVQVSRVFVPCKPFQPSVM
jgi:hypothetical protein